MSGGGDDSGATHTYTHAPLASCPPPPPPHMAHHTAPEARPTIQPTLWTATWRTTKRHQQSDVACPSSGSLAKSWAQSWAQSLIQEGPCRRRTVLLFFTEVTTYNDYCCDYDCCYCCHRILSITDLPPRTPLAMQLCARPFLCPPHDFKKNPTCLLTPGYY